MGESLFSPAPPTAAPRSTTPEEAPVTDFDIIESQKENIRPLASGRSAATLAEVFKQSEAERLLEEGHEKYRKAIEEAERREREGEDMVGGVQDVLDVYYQYILFIIQHYPSSTTHSLPLIESTTRRFLPDVRYSQDIRYLRLWIMYTRNVERKEEVWAFLESKDVGTRHALFYEEWADALYALGRKKKADEIYQLGINRRASPLERLKTRHKEFLTRIMAISGDQIEDDPTPSSATAPLRTPASSRSVLGQVGSVVSGVTQLAPSQRISKGLNGSKMEIFTDDKRNDDGSAGEWEDFGTRDSRRKENTVEATAWKGETLPQSAARNRIAPRTPKIEVFKETSDEINGAMRPAEEVFSRSRQPLSEAELLKTDPLRNYDTTSLPTSIPTVPAVPAPPSARKPPKPKSSRANFQKHTWECPNDGPRVKNAAGKMELRMFDWDGVFKNGEEWSLEEVRAKQRGLYGKEWKGDVKNWEMGWHVPGSSTPKPEEKKKSMPSPTVNTKLANEDIMEMFNQTLHGGKARRDSDSEEDSEDDSDEEADVPIVTAPTPLPSKPGMAMMTPGAGMVPPTPTPAGAFSRPPAPMVFQDENENASRPTPMIFQDENAPPPSATKKLNIFSDASTKTPMATRTPLGASGSKPKAFGIFQEESAGGVEETPSIKSKAPVASNIFATPAVNGRGGPRRVLAMAIPEEDEDGEEPVEATSQEDDEQVLQRVISEAQQLHLDEQEDEEDGENYPAHRPKLFMNVHAMTPITERTCEFTMHTMHTATTRRSSVQASTTRRTSGLTEIDSEGDAFVQSRPTSDSEELHPVPEVEDEVSKQHSPRLSTSPTTTLFPPSKADDSPMSNERSLGYDRSGSITSPFKLADGYTVHPGAGPSSSMMVVDRTSTMHFGRGNSVEPEKRLSLSHPVQQPSTEVNNLPNPCNPSDDDVIATILSQIDPSLGSLEVVSNHRSVIFNRLDTLQKHAKSKGRRGSAASRTSMGGGDDYMILDIAGSKYEIWDKIGEGGYGAVFLAVDVAARAAQDAKDDDSNDDDSDDDEEDNDCFVAIKVERPSSVWETVILDRIHRRLSNSSILKSIIQSQKLFAFQDESYLLLEYSSQGTLLDLVNKASTLGIAPAAQGSTSSLDELVAIFFIIELLKITENLHNAGFIHGDLKIDNCLVRLDNVQGGNTAWSSQYNRHGDGGWAQKGLRVIDFGRAIDLTLYPAGENQKFIADWKVDEKDCVEMREGKEWSWETDYFGLAGIAFCMLFGKYISTESVLEDGKKRYKISMPLKRYWQTTLWTSLFDMLLNPHDVRSDGSLPITNELSSIRVQFEDWLEENCQKGGKNLRAMLKKVETATMMGKRL